MSTTQGASFKKPESVLVVIYCQTTNNVLMLQRADDPCFWQSVTGSLEQGEQPIETALREVQEEVGIDLITEQVDLIDYRHCVEYEIYPQFRHRYAPEVSHNLEHWFFLPLLSEREVVLTEHVAYRWLPFIEAAALARSESNREAIQLLPLSRNFSVD